MKGADWLHHVMEIDHPWHIHDISFNPRQRRIDLWVSRMAERGGWFSRARPPAAQGPEQVWRHTNFGGCRCFVHLTADDSRVPDSWSGDDKAPFTRALARQVAALLLEGIKIPTICALLDIPLEDLWKFKHHLDSGRTGLGTVNPLRASTPAMRGVASADAATAVPDLQDPVWESLLEGSVDIDIRVLSLKLLLSKLREQMRVIKDADVRMLKTHEIYRYFSRHEHLLGHELKQLRRS